MDLRRVGRAAGPTVALPAPRTSTKFSATTRWTQDRDRHARPGFDLAHRALAAGKRSSRSRRRSGGRAARALAPERDLAGDARPPPALPPRRPEAPGPRRTRRAHDASACTATAESGRDAAIVAARRDLSVILYLIGEEPEEVWARGNAFLTPGGSEDLLFLLPFPGRRTICTSPGSKPHKMRKITVHGECFNNMELEQDDGVREGAPAHLRRVAYADQGTCRVRRSRQEPLRSQCTTSSVSRATASFAEPPSRSRCERLLVRAGAASSLRHLDCAGVRCANTPAIRAPPGRSWPTASDPRSYTIVGKQPALSPRSTAARESSAGWRNRTRGRSSQQAASSSPGTRLGARARPTCCVSAAIWGGERRDRARHAGRERHDDRRRCAKISRRTPTSPRTPPSRTRSSSAPRPRDHDKRQLHGAHREQHALRRGRRIRRGAAARPAGGAVLLPGMIGEGFVGDVVVR